jgi:hypothetical protein
MGGWVRGADGHDDDDDGCDGTDGRVFSYDEQQKIISAAM